jgi:histone H3/H4
MGSSDGTKRKPVFDRVGLTFRVSKVRKMARRSVGNKRMAASCPVYLSAVAEHIAKGLLNDGHALAGTRAAGGHKRIKARVLAEVLKDKSRPYAPLLVSNVGGIYVADGAINAVDEDEE